MTFLIFLIELNTTNLFIMDAFLIIGGIIAALVAFFAGYYNSFIKLRNQVQSAWSDIDTQLKKRYDLIPNILSTVKGYATHETGTLEKVTEMRTRAMNAETPKEQAGLENMLSGALKSLFAVAEAYPDLKANSNFMELQETLETVENDINMSRRYYNGTVQTYNNKTQMFPGNFIAGMFGFKDAEFFEADDDERENVKVEF